MAIVCPSLPCRSFAWDTTTVLTLLPGLFFGQPAFSPAPCSLFPSPYWCCLKIEVFRRHNRALGLQCTAVPARGGSARCARGKSAVSCIPGPAFRVGEMYMGLRENDAPASTSWLRVLIAPSCLLRFVASGQTWPALTGHSAHRFSAHHRRQTMLKTTHK